MTRRLLVTDLGARPAADWPGLCAALLAEGQPRLVATRLTGGVAALGRWQRTASVLKADTLSSPPVRRVTGGRTVALGEGLLALALVLPHRSWLVSEDPQALPASRFLNRAIRGVLAGLGALGIAAHYFGRDYVSVASAQAGLVGFEIDESGAALLECVLAAESHWWLPAELDALPPRPSVRGVPGPGRVTALEKRSSAEVLEAVARGHETTFGVEAAPDPLRLVPLSVVEASELPRRSSLHPTPAGFVEAQVAIASGQIEEARFFGDFIADSGGIRSLERAVVGAPPTLEALAPRMNGVYSDAAHTILGVDDLEVLANALVEAATR